MANELRKMTIELEAGSWHGSGSESVWVQPVGQNRYVLENSPFYAFGVSYQDVVRANEKNGQLFFGEIVARGGHSTYRIILLDSKELFEEYWQVLQQLGCTYEEGLNRLLSVDIPPLTDIHAAYKVLEAGEKAGVWSFEEGHCGHLLDVPGPLVS